MGQQEMKLRAIGRIRSPIKNRGEAADQKKVAETLVDLVIFSDYKDGLEGLKDEGHIIILTWMHQADRDVLKVHPRGDSSRPKRGVFSTRSPDRPNPLGLYVVRVVRFGEDTITVGGMDAIDGTLIVDIKPFRPEFDIFK
jgi:L-fuculose-phosphate aldolase